MHYIDYILYCINKLKKIFCKFRKEKRNLIDYFDFFKYYILSYWILYIKKYKTSIKYNNLIEKTIYKEVKLQYSRINKYLNYQKQILYYNTRKIKIQTINNLLLYNSSRALN